MKLHSRNAAWRLNHNARCCLSYVGKTAKLHVAQPIKSRQSGTGTGAWAASDETREPLVDVQQGKQFTWNERAQQLSHWKARNNEYEKGPNSFFCSADLDDNTSVLSSISEAPTEKEQQHANTSSDASTSSSGQSATRWQFCQELHEETMAKIRVVIIFIIAQLVVVKPILVIDH